MTPLLPLTLFLVLGLGDPQAQPNAAAPETKKGAHDTELPIPGVTVLSTADASIVETVLDAPVAEVWKIFSTEEGFKALGAALVKIDFRIGGLIKSTYTPAPKGSLDDERHIENEILAYEPFRSISYRIHQPPPGFPFPDAWKTTWSVVTLTPVGETRTHLRLAMQGYTPDKQSQDMKAFFDKGNAWTMQRLEQHFVPPGSAQAAAPASTGASGASRPIIDGALFDASGMVEPGITREIIVNAPPMEVFKAFTTAEGLKSFLVEGCNVDLSIGGPYELYFGMDRPLGQRGDEGCQVLSYLPGRMLSFSWSAPPQFPVERARRAWVVMFFTPVDGDKTRVELVHTGFGTTGHWPEVKQYFEHAWPKVLAALKDHYQPKAANSAPGK